MIDGEYEAKTHGWPPDFSPDEPLSRAALAELRRRYDLLSPHSLQQVHFDAWERCKLERNGRPPRAEQIQVLMTAWKALRKGSGRA
jgi:hypothetical protein